MGPELSKDGSSETPGACVFAWFASEIMKVHGKARH